MDGGERDRERLLITEDISGGAQSKMENVSMVAQKKGCGDVEKTNAFHRVGR